MADYLDFTINDLRTLKRDSRATCGCDPICPACQERRAFVNTFICEMLYTGTRTVGEIPDDIMGSIVDAFS